VNHRWIVAGEFRIFGLVLGLPALAVLINLAWDWWSLRGAPAPQPSQNLDVGKYGLVALLSYGAEGIGAMFKVLGTLASFAAVMVGVVSVLALVLGVLLYFTGGGIDRGEGWARVIAIMVSIVCLCSWIGSLFVLQDGALGVAGVGTALALYTLWVLGWKFA
jgi:hypothetical protein